MKHKLSLGALVAVLLFTSVAAAVGNRVQRRRGRERPAKVCHDPTQTCRTTGEFGPHDLPFRLAECAVICETEQFYAVILKSMPASPDECEKFVPESERLAAQRLFPRRKVFASRCEEPWTLYYTNVAPGQRIMAVYAGATRAEALRTLEAVKATGKFPGANLRRMRAGFNGT